MSLILTDIGLNLTHDSFDHDRETVIAQAVAAGVTRMVITGATLAGSRAAIALARRHPLRMRATAGVHPHHAQELQGEDRVELDRLIRQPEVAAAGECGLDYFRNLSPPAEQRRAFALQLELAAEAGKPVFLHQRDAHADFCAILREHRPALAGGVAHCFTGNDAELDDCLAMGLSIGITGWICDERRGMHLRELVRRIPADRLMLETDAPYLLPRDLVPKPATRRNEPRWLPHINAVVAQCRGETPEALAAITHANSLRFFGMAEPVATPEAASPTTIACH
jgi:TatD DNase family protein